MLSGVERAGVMRNYLPGCEGCSFSFPKLIMHVHVCVCVDLCESYCKEADS